MNLPISIVAPEFIATIMQLQLHIESVVHNQYTIIVLVCSCNINVIYNYGLY